MKDKTKAIIGTGVLATSIATAASAQDFFDGQPGPSDFQLDLRANYSEGSVSGAVIPKFFGKKWLVAAPIGIDGDDATLLGVNAGYIGSVDDSNSFIAALGLFRDGEGEYNVLNPNVALTNVTGRWSTDLAAAMPIDTNTGERGGNFSATIGYGVTERLRLGGSATVAKGQNPSYQVFGRYDFPLKNGSRHWVELYGREKTIGFRAAFNPRIGR